MSQPDSGPGLDLSVFAQLAASLGAVAEALNRENAHRQRMLQVIRQVPFIINVPLTAGAATLNPTSYGPDVGYYWSIKKIAAVNFTAGTVNTYIDNTGGEPIVPFTQAGVASFGKGQQLMHPGSNIAVVAAGITGTVQIWGKADMFESWYLPYYLG